MSEIIKAKIEKLSYSAGEIMRSLPLKDYAFQNFDINTAKASGLISFDAKNRVAYSKWVTPKRTRSYPFARIYDTYHFSGKRITIIPIIKDEGLGESKNKSNNDRINFITLSWMNLTNVYIILAWYDSATKKSSSRITNQKFNADYINKKIKEISEYQFDAHHWNNQHFITDFADVMKRAVKSYNGISEQLKVTMHPAQGHESFLQKILSEKNKQEICLEKFKQVTLPSSMSAALRETQVNHKHEILSQESDKKIIHIKNNLGGIYYLTADEIVIHNKSKIISLGEAKNSTRGKFPSSNDVKDGLFKTLLFRNISNIQVGNQAMKLEVGIRITGNFKHSISLPCSEKTVAKFRADEKLTASQINLLNLLQQEAQQNHFTITINPNHK